MFLVIYRYSAESGRSQSAIATMLSQDVLSYGYSVEPGRSLSAISALLSHDVLSQ